MSTVIAAVVSVVVAAADTSHAPDTCLDLLYVAMERWGLPTVLLLLVAFAIWRSAKFLARQLFGEVSKDGKVITEGIVTRLASRWIGFLDKMEELLVNIKDAITDGARQHEGECKESGVFMEEMRSVHAVDGPCSTVPLREAGKSACDAFVALVEGDAEAAKKHVEEARKKLG